ncbi:MAG: glycosyltransferase family 1 protein [Dehalococcoidia bacterium]|nr:glycosyltransferase family 1 protein [Dehalococcoidia bacterium]
MERIAFISVHGCPVARLGERDTGGMNVYVLQVAKELGKRGVKVDIYTRHHDPADHAITELGEHTRVIHVTAGPYGEPKDTLYQYLPQFLNNVKRFQVDHELEYSLVHSHYWFSGWVGSLLAEGWHVSHVTTFHTLAEIKKQARAGEQEPSIRSQGEWKIVHEADRVIAFSRHEKDALTRLYSATPSKVEIIPCGVDLELFKPSRKSSAKKQLGLQGKKVVLFVGRIEPLKAVDLLLRAVALLEDREKVHLLVVGGNPHRDRELRRVKALAVELGLGEAVSFTGTVDQNQLPTYYSAADVFVLPSYYESFGLVALEAMACGTPVIAARVGGLKDVVKEGLTGYLIPWRCPEPYAERLEVLLSHEDLRSSMGQAARKLAKEQGWGKVAERLLGVYQELLERPQSAVVGA